ncbi:hypothetical protein Pmani_037389 [Petrolisthes manimaculis]|uniref:Uncharacterized protein n=1 Tax=Petrolisthes manimaculis TaxID=1843537 RepID=A0AAE1TL74_9EUCA|nr:hypothetical protein Pmani_037389 [Petrolisthes manimaculis]
MALSLSSNYQSQPKQRARAGDAGNGVRDGGVRREGGVWVATAQTTHTRRQSDRLVWPLCIRYQQHRLVPAVATLLVLIKEKAPD